MSDHSILDLLDDVERDFELLRHEIKTGDELIRDLDEKLEFLRDKIKLGIEVSLSEVDNIRLIVAQMRQKRDNTSRMPKLKRPSGEDDQ